MAITIVAFIVILTSFRSIDGACLPAPPGFTFFPLMNIKASTSMLAYFGTKFSVDLPVTPPPSTLTLAAQQWYEGIDLLHGVFDASDLTLTHASM